MFKKWKSVLAISMTIILAVTFSACGTSSSAPSSAAAGSAAPASQQPSEAKDIRWPEKGISLICPFPAGGGMDTGARLLAPYLEKHLGVTVTVLNVEGANGWTGWTEAINAAPDGYTLVYANYPAQIAGYLNPSNNIPYTYRDFTPISNHVTDVNVIAIRPDEGRFSTPEEFIEYARNNEMTFTTGGNASDDHILITLLNKNFHTQITAVHMANTPEGIAAMLGGHVDGVVGNVSEFATRLEGGECGVIAVCAAGRNPFMPDIPTLEEAGFKNVYGSSSRGLLAPPNLDPAVKEKLLEAVKAAMTDPEHTAAAEAIGALIDPIYAEDFEAWLEEQEKNISGLSAEMGW